MEMDADLKKVLLNVVYYTLIAVMVAFVVFFMVTLANASMSLWEKVAYFILSGALVLLVVYDIICTVMQSQKYIAGFILYVITLLMLILSLVVFALNSANGRLLIDISEKFFRIIFFSYLINAMAILVYCIGESLIVNVTNRFKK